MRQYLYLFCFLLASCNNPKSYEDCIFEKMSGVTERVAAVAIKNACLSQFPIQSDFIEPTFKEVTMTENIWGNTQEHLKNVSITEIVSNSEITITNKNEKTITKLTIGTTDNGFCGNNKSDYKWLISCQGKVEANTTDFMKCSPEMPENSGICIAEVTYTDWVL